MQIEQKKSAIDLTELAIGVVVLGIVVSIGAVILNKMATSQITNAATYRVNNETVTATDGGTALANGWVKSIVLANNFSSGGVLTEGTNYTYTVNSDTGTGYVYNKSATFAKMNITYDVYNKSDPRFALPNNATIGLAEYGNWFKILVIVGIASVILALIFLAFGNKSSSTGGGTTY